VRASGRLSAPQSGLRIGNPGFVGVPDEGRDCLGIFLELVGRRVSTSAAGIDGVRPVALIATGALTELRASPRSGRWWRGMHLPLIQGGPRRRLLVHSNVFRGAARESTVLWIDLGTMA
jgi:hypothetical protein